MTRHTAPTRKVAARLVLEAAGERDESSGYRHEWVTRLRIGELTAEGPNAREAVDNLAAELLALASCPEAVQALAMFRHRLASARSVAEAPPKPAAPFADGEAVEVLIMDAHGALGRGRARVSADDNHGAPTRSNPMLQHIGRVGGDRALGPGGDGDDRAAHGQLGSGQTASAAAGRVSTSEADGGVMSRPAATSATSATRLSSRVTPRSSWTASGTGPIGE